MDAPQPLSRVSRGKMRSTYHETSRSSTTRTTEKVEKAAPTSMEIVQTQMDYYARYSSHTSPFACPGPNDSAKALSEGNDRASHPFFKWANALPWLKQGDLDIPEPKVSRNPVRKRRFDDDDEPPKRVGNTEAARPKRRKAALVANAAIKRRRDAESDESEDTTDSEVGGTMAAPPQTKKQRMLPTLSHADDAIEPSIVDRSNAASTPAVAVASGGTQHALVLPTAASTQANTPSRIAPQGPPLRNAASQKGTLQAAVPSNAAQAPASVPMPAPTPQVVAPHVAAPPAAASHPPPAATAATVATAPAPAPAPAPPARSRNGITRTASVVNHWPNLSADQIIQQHPRDLCGGTLLALQAELQANGGAGMGTQILGLLRQHHGANFAITSVQIRKALSLAHQREDADEAAHANAGRPRRCKRCTDKRILCSIRESGGSMPCQQCQAAEETCGM